MVRIYRINVAEGTYTMCDFPERSSLLPWELRTYELRIGDHRDITIENAYVGGAKQIETAGSGDQVRGYRQTAVPRLLGVRGPSCKEAPHSVVIHDALFAQQPRFANGVIWFGLPVARFSADLKMLDTCVFRVYGRESTWDDHIREVLTLEVPDGS